MNRPQRLVAFASFLVVLVVLVAVLAVAGALGPFELLLCVILAVPLSALAYRAVVRRVAGGRATR